MEKIKVSKLSETDGDIFYRLASKINELIDWVNEPDEGYDSLKTLEDKIEKMIKDMKVMHLGNSQQEEKVKFIMKNIPAAMRENYKPDWSLQDLWGEQLADKINDGLEKIYPTVKECDCNSKQVCVKCGDFMNKPSVTQDNRYFAEMPPNVFMTEEQIAYIEAMDEKIEEIISGLHKEFDDYHLDIQEFESWLRDKLKNL